MVAFTRLRESSSANTSPTRELAGACHALPGYLSDLRLQIGCACSVLWQGKGHLHALSVVAALPTDHHSEEILLEYSKSSQDQQQSVHPTTWLVHVDGSGVSQLCVFHQHTQLQHKSCAATLHPFLHTLNPESAKLINGT